MFVYFDCDECCCSAKIWSVVKKKNWFSLHVSPILCAHVSEYLFFCLFPPRLWDVQTSTHTQDGNNMTKILLHSFTKCCKHCCLYTRFQSYILYTHSVHCIIVIADCGPVTLIGKRGVVHFFFLRRQVRLFSLVFLKRSGRKTFSVLPDQNCRVVATLLQNVHASRVGMKKKVQSLLFVWFLFVLI